MDFFLKMILPVGKVQSIESRDLLRYRRIWWRTVLLTLAVALMPLAIMTGANYFLYLRSAYSEIRHQVSQDLSNISRSVEAVVEERVSALQLVSMENKLAEMTSDDIEQAFVNLRSSFGGFVDLGLIDLDGTQILYTGPYTLEGHNYFEEDWFHEVHLRDLFVSDVFLGHRKLPHFVVIVKQGEFLLRATVDMELLNRQVFIPASKPSDDVFLINRDGILQTDSRFHGPILSSSSLAVPPYSPNDEILEEVESKGIPYIEGYSYIRETPFVLIVLRRPANVLQDWLRSSFEFLAFLIVSTILIVIVVFASVTLTVKKIRAADLERRQMRKSVEHTSKMATIGRLAASVAHEINNPLAIINEKAGLLKDVVGADGEFPHQQKVLQGLDGITRSVDRCSAVTHRLLGFTRRIRLRQERIDLPALVAEVAGFLEKEATHRSVQIQMDFDANLPAIVSDRGQIEEVVLNLLNNAFAAVDQGGEIRVSVRSEAPNNVSIVIEDNGCGIPKKDLKQIFEPFFSTKGEFGTGLGLCITYDLVQKLGGRIEVESEEGKGACFTVFLPIGTVRPLE